MFTVFEISSYDWYHRWCGQWCSHGGQSQLEWPWMLSVVIHLCRDCHSDVACTWFTLLLASPPTTYSTGQIPVSSYKPNRTPSSGENAGGVVGPTLVSGMRLSFGDFVSWKNDFVFLGLASSSGAARPAGRARNWLALRARGCSLATVLNMVPLLIK
jgi:hypothetical protein